jgi:hypothetical protein
MGFIDADGQQKLIYRAPLILHEKNRRLYFVLENPEAELENRYLSYTIIQHISGHKTIESLRRQPANPTSAPADKVPAPASGEPVKAEPKPKAA